MAAQYATSEGAPGKVSETPLRTSQRHKVETPQDGNPCGVSGAFPTILKKRVMPSYQGFDLRATAHVL